MITIFQILALKLKADNKQAKDTPSACIKISQLTAETGLGDIRAN